jgi:fatty-acyl-CoA synthase
MAPNLLREWRFVRGVTGALRAIKDVEADSANLVPDDWERSVDRHAARPAFSMDGRTLSYAEADAFANRVAHWATAQGLGPGSVVAMVLPNRLDYVPLWLGLLKAGVTAALINNNLQGAALAHCIGVGGAAHVIVDAESAPAVAAARDRLPAPAAVWALDGAPSDADLAAALAAFPATRPDRAVRAAQVAGDAALYIYTSGTTGLPKAAVVTHVRAQVYMRSFAGAMRTTPEDRVFVVLPLYHSTGGLVGVGAAVSNGGCVVLRRKFSASSFWADVNAEGATLFVYIGELCRYMVGQPAGEGERGHRLRFAFGNGLRPDVWDRFAARFAIPRVLEFYGATEGNVSLVNFDRKPGAIGRVPPYLRHRFNVRLVRFDLDSQTPLRGPDGFCIACAPGEIGEAVGEIGTEHRTQYAGYAEGGDRAESERKVLQGAFKPGDRWFRTGDLMRQDRDGYFYFVDRLGDTFRWKGENVSTGQVAEVLAAAPGVVEAVVYGVEVPGAEGFDPARVSDPLLVRDPAVGYRALDNDLHAAISSSQFRL